MRAFSKLTPTDVAAATTRKLVCWSGALFFAGFFAVFHQTQAAPNKPDWRIVETKFPTPDHVVSGYNVLDFGARGDAKMDCTEAFQKALDQMKEAGGGTVFVPEGRFAIKGNLLIPESVTLRGEWQDPSGGDLAVKGTILMAYAGRGETEGEPFIALDQSAGIKNLTIWYPEQEAANPVPYPFCLIQKGVNNATFENLSLINPYQGIRIGPGSNELHYVHNVFGTPLKIGVQYDSTTDIGRLENLRFSPVFWSQSQLPGAPEKGANFEKWLLANGTAIHMLRSDWEYVSYITIEGYARGFQVSEGVAGAANAQFYYMLIRNCGTALEVEKTNPYGMVFTKCSFEGNQVGVKFGAKFDSAVLFSTCFLGGHTALRMEGNGTLLLERCTVTRGDVAMVGGVMSMVASALKDPNSRMDFGPDVVAASLAGCKIAGGESSILRNLPQGRLQISDAEVEAVEFPNYDGNQQRTRRPAKASLTVVRPSGGDDTPAIQAALQSQSLAGGGIVFLPAGDYILQGELSVPSGVEMRGVHDVPHHTRAGGSVLHVYPRKTTEPTVILNAESGLRGLSFNYPEQSVENVKPSPFLLQGRGKNIYVINVNAANPYRFLDLASFRCDRHFVDYLSGAPLLVGISIGGGSLEGEVRNTQFNPHYWKRTPKKNRFFKNAPKGTVELDTDVLWSYQKEHLDALVIADCASQFLFQNFVFGSRYGIHFTRQQGKGASECISHGHGTDGSKVGVFFEHGSGKIHMINSELVSMSSENKTAIKLDKEFTAHASLINTLVWGSPDLLAEVANGTLLLHGLHANRHGNGLDLRGGHLRGINLNFAERRGSHLTLSGGDSTLSLIGCVTTGVLQREGKPLDQLPTESRIRAINLLTRPSGKK